jgi:hypothetical protein
MHVQSAGLFFSRVRILFDSCYLCVCKGLVRKKSLYTSITYCFSNSNSREQNKQTHTHINERTGAWRKEKKEKEKDEDDDALPSSSRPI